MCPTPNMRLGSSVGCRGPTSTKEAWVQIQVKPGFFSGFFSAMTEITDHLQGPMVYLNFICRLTEFI